MGYRGFAFPIFVRENDPDLIFCPISSYFNVQRILHSIFVAGYCRYSFAVFFFANIVDPAASPHFPWSLGSSLKKRSNKILLYMNFSSVVVGNNFTMLFSMKSVLHLRCIFIGPFEPVKSNQAQSIILLLKNLKCWFQGTKCNVGLDRADLQYNGRGSQGFQVVTDACPS